MTPVERHLERVLETLRAAISGKGFTQLEVQESLGWSRCYISQLLGKHKPLRFEQLFAILNVLGVDPGDYFAEVFGAPKRRAAGPRPPRRHRRDLEPPEDGGDSRRQRARLEALVALLETKKLITAAELEQAIAAAGQELPLE